ncbi:MAG: hypothetical protein K9L26_05070 [Candidatus Izimaplasma sp.]|nr:hypothetical protein [Candidatus Izimaplasma bacterium]
MARTPVTDASRKVKRDIGKVFGDNFLKIITEVILNADDSYNRLEQDTRRTQARRILMRLHRKRRVMEIIDQAEGMSDLKLQSIFSQYGGDYSGGESNKAVRGLFGQGASDVMFLSAFHKFPAYMVSICNNQAARIDFYFDDKKEISVNALTDDIDHLRQKYSIKESGTYVSFGLPKHVKIPKRKVIKAEIEAFYMLRYILSNPYRDVILYDDEIKHTLDSSRYLMNSQNVLLKNKRIQLKFDDQKLQAVLNIYEKKPEMPQKIIIRDENYVVFDETLFNLEHTHGASYIAGELVIHGISDLLRDKLNAKEPEEILRDSRDGFDRRHRYTKYMNKRVGHILNTVIEAFNIERESVTYTLNNNKKLIDALKKINSYFNELKLSRIGGLDTGTSAPSEGLRFARNEINITRRKTYALQLFINTDDIDQDTPIELTIKSNNDKIAVETLTVMYTEDDIKHENLVIKYVIIKGLKITEEPALLTATYQALSTSVLINVVTEKIIYPNNGLEFIPKRKYIAPSKTVTLNLWFDTAFVPLQSEIKITREYESQLFNEPEILIVEETSLVTDTIGVMRVTVTTHDYLEKIVIEASTNNLNSEAIIYVQEAKDQEEGADGLLSQLELVFDPGNWQANMIEERGTLQINGSHIINKTIMGKLGKKHQEQPEFDGKQLQYLYELIAFESAKLYVKDKYKNDTDKEFNELSNEIQEHKTYVYQGLIE